MSPREICNKYHQIHSDIYKWFNISFDIFGRTSNVNPSDKTWSQTKICHDIFEKLVLENLKNEKEIEQLYSPELNSFFADRYIKGICPYCNYNDANGDQCDNCGKLYSSTDLLEPYYKLNLNYKLIKKKLVIYFKNYQI